MKKTSLVILLVTVLFQVENASARSLNSAKFQERTLTKNKIALSDPYYQLRQMKVSELTEEEALKYANEELVNNAVDNNIITKEFKTSLVPGGVPGITGGIPTIPPSPPSAGNGGLATGTGPGGNVQAPAPTTGGVLEGIIMVIDKLIAIGEKIIPTIQKGKAVVTNNPMSAISVLPRLDSKDPVVHDMGNWTIPVSKHYKISYENGFGSEVVSFVYSISFQHSGTYNNKGHYLAGVRVSAREINVLWGFDLDATSQLIQISNVGTVDNVIAGATIEITYTVKNWTRNLTTSQEFHVTGDGRIFQLD